MQPMHETPIDDMWTYRSDAYPETGPEAMNDLVGYDVEATDGSIGKVDEATHDADRNYLVVDTGPWIFGKKVLLPAGVVQSVDIEASTVFISRTRDNVKDSPGFDPEEFVDPTYQEAVGSYYGSGAPTDRNGI